MGEEEGKRRERRGKRRRKRRGKRREMGQKRGQGEEIALKAKIITHQNTQVTSWKHSHLNTNLLISQGHSH